MRKRKRVGILLGAINNEHPNRILKELYQRFAEADVDVHFFIGTETTSYSGATYSKSNNCDYQYFRLYDLCNFEDLDLLVVAYGSIHIYHAKEPLDEFVSRFPNVPIIFLEDTIQYPGTVSVATNNYQGTVKCVEHLICQHKCSRIAFLAGPKDNRDSNERLNAYHDTMHTHGLRHSEELIIHGDFSESVETLVEELLDRNPGLEAIVSANDEMALSVYKVCDRRGIRIGKDLLITGFDDIDMASYLNPPLTTVRQDVAGLAQATVNLAMAIFRGEPVKPASIPVNFIQRESCGCDKSEPTSTEELFVRTSAIDTVAGAMVDLRGLQKNSWIGPSLVREMISQIDDIEKAMRILGEELKSIGCTSSFISVFKDRYEYLPGDTYIRPSTMNVMLKQTQDGIKTYSPTDSPVVTDGTLPDVIHETDVQQSFVSYLLFDGKMQYGMLTVEIDPKDISLYYTLSLHISTFFRFYEMHLQQRVYREELKEKNNILSFSATHDPLTGLYNRYGALEAADRILSRVQDKEAVFFIADIDHLKEINDTFGHTAGDTAIKTAAELLNRVIGSKGLVARVGGDEFCGGFVLDKSPTVEERVQEIYSEMKAAFKEFNIDSDEKFFVDTSIGLSRITENSKDGIHQAYIKADIQLYDAKKFRRQSIVK